MAEPRKKPESEEDPVLEALRDAPIDDEPETDEERRAIDEALADERAGRVISTDEVMSRQAKNQKGPDLHTHLDDKELADELARRAQSVIDETAETIPSEEVYARLDAKLAKHRT